MPVRRSSISRGSGLVFTSVLIAVSLLFIIPGADLTAAQETKHKNEAEKNGGNAGAVERGRYLVVGVAHCGDCHTPRNANGEPDTTRWLTGGPVPYMPARPDPNWPLVVPRIAGMPPASDAAMITLFMTGIWVDGKPLRSPMPRFQMTRSDAEAVLAYLKSLTPGR